MGIIPETAIPNYPLKDFKYGYFSDDWTKAYNHFFASWAKPESLIERRNVISYVAFNSTERKSIYNLLCSIGLQVDSHNGEENTYSRMTDEERKEFTTLSARNLGLLIYDLIANQNTKPATIGNIMKDVTRAFQNSPAKDSLSLLCGLEIAEIKDDSKIKAIILKAYSQLVLKGFPDYANNISDEPFRVMPLVTKESLREKVEELYHIGVRENQTFMMNSTSDYFEAIATLGLSNLPEKAKGD